ncbi:Multiple myeloma tumor-associated protein-like protein [Planoprotostelium fungivorum]|uniref:Multiple myeloma tumor-associated protein-like protein n=1 Tax=Planoprotostelium fungivorum TaxID=1890364 RepID=A0A2P6N6A0_9EUKA|nr:Multiple myeloma tumor-associated protein-like protein [Planoprotostelium fungivorum]
MSIFAGMGMRGGTRGGKDQFNWDDIRGDKFKENYLGQTLKLQQNWWYKGEMKHGGKVVEADRTNFSQQMAKEKTKYADEIRALKEREEQLRMEALGLRPKSRVNNEKKLEKHEFQELVRRGNVERDEYDLAKMGGVGHKGFNIVLESLEPQKVDRLEGVVPSAASDNATAAPEAKKSYGVFPQKSTIESAESRPGELEERIKREVMMSHSDKKHKREKREKKEKKEKKDKKRKRREEDREARSPRREKEARQPIHPEEFTQESPSPQRSSSRRGEGDHLQRLTGTEERRRHDSPPPRSTHRRDEERRRHDSPSPQRSSHRREERRESSPSRSRRHDSASPERTRESPRREERGRRDEREERRRRHDSQSP